MLLLAGIAALNRVRMEIPLEKENQEKLVKFMIRIAVFSGLYLVPLLTVIACYLYESSYRTIWETTWVQERCRDYHIPCPYKVICPVTVWKVQKVLTSNDFKESPSSYKIWSS